MSHPRPETREGQSAPPKDEQDALAIADGKDMRYLYVALASGWQITPERKRRYFAALDEIIRSDTVDPKTKAQAAKCLLMEQQMMLRHAHKMMDDVRLDSGKATSRVEITGLGEAVARYREAGIPEDRWPPAMRDFARGAHADGNRN